MVSVSTFSWHFVLLKIPFVGLNLDSHRGIRGCGPYWKSALAVRTTPLFAVEYGPPEAIASRLRAGVDPPTMVHLERHARRSWGPNQHKRNLLMKRGPETKALCAGGEGAKQERKKQLDM